MAKTEVGSPSDQKQEDSFCHDFADRRANLQRLKSDDPLAALQLPVPDSPTAVIEQSASLQPIQESQALDVLPIEPSLITPTQPALRQDIGTREQDFFATSSRLAGAGPLFAGAEAAQFYGADQAQNQLRQEGQPQLIPLSPDTGTSALEQQLPANQIHSSQQWGTAGQALEGVHAQPAAAKPQPGSDDMDTEHWQGSQPLSLRTPPIDTLAQESPAHNDVAAADDPKEKDQDPFAATFPTSLIAPTLEDVEADEWDTFQAPEEERPQPQSLDQTDLLGNEGKSRHGQNGFQWAHSAHLGFLLSQLI